LKTIWPPQVCEKGTGAVSEKEKKKKDGEGSSLGSGVA